MPEWVIERGIGETRCARITENQIVESRILLEGVVRAGTRLAGRLKSVRPAVVAGNGDEYLLPKGAPGVAEGNALKIEVTRERIPGAEPWKRPLAVVTNAAVGAPASEEAVELPLPAQNDLLGDAGWWDLVEEARSGIVRFEGGELHISPTPAMTLIDVDGFLPPKELAIKGAQAAAEAILRHDIGGSIGIDLPTVGGRPERQAMAAAVDAILPQPFERTAVNGFGFLQIVRPRRRASLIELAQDRPSFEARALLRRAALECTGQTCLIAAPAVIEIVQQNRAWIDRLGRQVGGTVTLRADPKRPIHGGYAQAI